MQSTHMNRVFGLDFLRAIAILQVTQGHAYQLHYQFWDYSPWATQILSYAIFNFVDGVDLFFVLSGFLIGGILIKTFENQYANFKSLFHFWIKRWFRTLPLYFLVLIINILIFCFIFSDSSILGLKTLWRNNILHYFFFVQNFTTPGVFFCESWSLCVEEWSYLVLPSLFFCIIRYSNLSTKNSFLVGIITVLILTMVARIIFWHFNYQNSHLSAWEIQVMLRDITFLRLDAIAFGILGAWINHYYHNKWLSFKWVFFVFGLIICLYFKNFSNETIENLRLSNGYLFVMIENSLGCCGILCLLPLLTFWKTQNGFLGKLIQHISLISYSMYLFNLSFLIGLIKYFLPPHSVSDSYFNVLLFWVILIGLSSFTYYYFEKPMTALREAFVKK